MLTRRTFAAMTVALALPLAGLSLPAFAQSADTAAAEPLPDVVLGDPNAPVTIVEYASMTCPHCANFHKTTFQELKKEYIDTGKVKFVLREFPFDPLAAAVFMIARCSDDKYYDVVDLFFETQGEWAVREGALAKIRGLARQTGMTDSAFEACLTDQKLLDGINAVKDRGYSEFNVTGTPTILIDGEKLEGARTMNAFREIIDPKLDT
ncbi:DsbA family protein [Acuticoccus sp. M5D2P5]|uniref:DsbA family protein n=1 Tax=Acuticoccus kalidii TaxID=2910977 RepID=UPI001F2ED7ED|nr:DsbA family protein [Acuticoccus kalidii]MCF3936057.1 DsbA family protein [Acuticoccus kalidii]